MNFNKLYEDIFKPASYDEVKIRQEQGKLERFKEWMDENNIRYTTDGKGNVVDVIDVNVRDKMKRTPLFQAIILLIFPIIKLLLTKDININSIDILHETPLDLIKYMLSREYYTLFQPKLNKLYKVLRQHGAKLSKEL